MTITRLTPLIGAAVRINSSGETAVAVALGDAGTAWVRLADGQQKQYLIEDLTVIAPGIAGAKVTRHTLSPAARKLLADAIPGGRRAVRCADGIHFTSVPSYIINMTVANGWSTHVPELRDNGMIQIAQSMRHPRGQAWMLTEAGEHLRTNLLENRVMRHLAELARTELDGESLSDIAAYLDNDAVCPGHALDDFTPTSGQGLSFPLECDGACVEYIGPGADGFLPLFRHVAAWSGQSGADLRQEIEQRLGWA